ncbi:MAG: hypothetical protein JNJ82_12005 [Opitutaceae bacterium]|nr:hypothetical protein [Opitutaceae bacterium]
MVYISRLEYDSSIASEFPLVAALSDSTIVGGKIGSKTPGWRFSSVFEAGGKRFAIGRGGIACGSFTLNEIVIYDSSGVRKRSFTIDKPQVIQAQGDCFALTNAAEDFYIIGEGVRRISDVGSVKNLFFISQSHLLVEGDERVYVWNEDSCSIVCRRQRPVVAVAALDEFIAISWLGGGLELFDRRTYRVLARYKAEGIAQFQCLAIVQGPTMYALAQTKGPLSRSLVEVNMSSNKVTKIKELTHNGGLGLFKDSVTAVQLRADSILA